MTTPTNPAGPTGIPERPIPGSPTGAETNEGSAPFDPLRLCIYTTIAVITWVAGPFAVLAFAGLGLAGYWKAHQAGMTRSKCYLRDVRLVLAYLGVIAVLAAVASVLKIHGWFA